MVAIKVERVDNKKQVLKLEVAVLKKLQGIYKITVHQNHLYPNSLEVMLLETNSL